MCVCVLEVRLVESFLCFKDFCAFIYVQRIVQAHTRTHAHTERYNGVCGCVLFVLNRLQ